MGLTVTGNGGGDFKQLDPGTYIGVCYRIIDLGTQHGEYQGKPRTRKQVLVSWEFPNELIDEGEYAGQPFTMSKFYTASLSEKASLRKDLESWRGRAFSEIELSGFNLVNILGKGCMIGVISGDNGKSKAGAVMSLPRGTQAPKVVNRAQVFDIDEWNDETFGAIPKGIQRIIMESDEGKRRGNQSSPSNQPDDYHPPGDNDEPF